MESFISQAAKLRAFVRPKWLKNASEKILNFLWFLWEGRRREYFYAHEENSAERRRMQWPGQNPRV